MSDWTFPEMGMITPFGAALDRAPRGPSRGPPLETLALPLGNQPSDAWPDPTALS